MACLRKRRNPDEHLAVDGGDNIQEKGPPHDHAAEATEYGPVTSAVDLGEKGWPVVPPESEPKDGEWTISDPRSAR